MALSFHNDCPHIDRGHTACPAEFPLVERARRFIARGRAIGAPSAGGRAVFSIADRISMAVSDCYFKTGRKR
ncbi:MAG TPA: hypothetical protein VM186_06900 [Planctomycetota bacterium]|nr:hypothetical protein [Planctomycetota bacterium]